MTEREFAISVVRRLQEAGFEALWAGGCVRDELLNLIPKDYDVATNARPEEVRQLFRRTVAVGMSFGVVEVVGPRTEQGHLMVQVATFRSDGDYSDGRRPDQVVFSDAREDALRRDFTINGMFFDPIREELLDFVGGQEDLRTGILRAIGDPHQRFQEDKLRLLRAARIATRFSLQIEPVTLDAIKSMASQVAVVSAERIAEELRKLLVDPQRKFGVELLDQLGLIEPIIPELLPLKILVSGSHFSLWDHTCAVLDLLGPGVSFPLAFAAWLHEIGHGIENSSKNPQQQAAKLAFSIGQRLRLSNAERDRAVWIIEHQKSLRNAPSLRPSTLKKLFIHPGIEELLAFHEADARAEGLPTDSVAYCRELLTQWTEEDFNPPPLITGDDLKRAGFRPGPQFKYLLGEVRDLQLDGILQTVEQAWEYIKKDEGQWTKE